MTGRTRVTGLTWDHPRAYRGLESETHRFNRAQDRIELVWERHSLRGFEQTPITETTARYDLVILDHPFMGDAAASGALADLSRHPDLASLAEDSVYIGPSARSYAYGGGVWALPIDAACQTAVFRPDMLARPPDTLPEILDLARRHTIAMAMACPHAFMNYLTIAGLLGADIAGTGDRLLPDDIAHQALDMFCTLSASLPPEAFGWSSIDTLEAMATRDDIAYCPMVFCFNSYAQAQPPGRACLRYAALPELKAGHGSRGAVAGGAGLAVAARSPVIDDALVVVAHLASAEAQIRMACDGGQPARIEAWQDTDADHANGGFFSDCASTMRQAIVRPRHAGYMALQDGAGDLLRDHAINRNRSSADVIDAIESLFRSTRDAAR